MGKEKGQMGRGGRLNEGVGTEGMREEKGQMGRGRAGYRREAEGKWTDMVRGRWSNEGVGTEGRGKEKERDR